MSMETVHTMIKDGKTNPRPFGKVIHGIHRIINSMESMNNNHLNKMNLIKGKEAVVRRALRSCLKVSWFSRRINKRQDAAMRNLETQIQKLSRQLMEECQISTLSEEAISLEENGEELQIEEERDCELIGESLNPQALEEDEEEESPEKGPEVVLELECDNMVGEQKEQVVECEERKEVPIVDFV